MKKYLLTILVVTAFFFSSDLTSQVRVNLNVNLGVRPTWGLPGNYSGDYYYLPEIDSYYDIPRHQFIYFDGFGWVFASALPYQFRDYDLYNGYKVVINEPRPYLNNQMYRQRYSRYYNTYQRPVIYSQGHNNYSQNRNSNGFDNHHYGNQGNQSNRYGNDPFNRGRENQQFDNKRNGDYRNDHEDRGRGREDENDHGNGRGHDKGKRHGKG